MEDNYSELLKKIENEGSTKDSFRVVTSKKSVQRFSTINDSNKDNNKRR